MRVSIAGSVGFQGPDVAIDLGQDGKRRTADPKTIAALTGALKDADKDVREAALNALVQLRDPGIYEPLVQALSDASPDVRERAAFGLGQLRDKRAAGPLTNAVKDSNAGVREQAVFALGQLRDRSAVHIPRTAHRGARAVIGRDAAQAKAVRAIETREVEARREGAGLGGVPPEHHIVRVGWGEERTPTLRRARYVGVPSSPQPSYRIRSHL